MLRKLLLPLLFVGLFAAGAFAQTGSITGTVTNQDGEPVPTANVLLVEIGQGDATNLEGEYTIDDVPAGTYTLRVTFIGYADFTEQVTIEPGQTLEQDVTLQTGAVGLEELVVTGFGVESQIESTASIATVDVSAQLENVPVVSTNAALQGAVTGLQISGNSGTPGSTVDINIRGVSSINAQANPLYVIDGVPVVTGEINNSAATSQLSTISSLNMNNIENISVLKGPVATARYGARGSNGVIVITTKSGTPGQTTYTLNAQTGSVSRAVDGPDVLNAENWDMLYEEGFDNAGSPDVESPWNGTTNTNWKDIVTNEDALSQSYSLSAAGGTPQATYYGSLGFTAKDGITIGTDVERYNGRFNFGYNFTPTIRIDNNFTGSYTNQNGILEGAGYFGNPVLSRYFISPWQPAFTDDGTPNLDVLGVFHPVFTINNDINDKKQFRLINSTQLFVELTDDLSFSTRVGIDFINLEEKYHDNPIYGDGATTNGFTQVIYTREFKGSLRSSLNYILDINDENTLDVSLIADAQIDKFYRIAAAGQGFATIGLSNLTNAGTPVGAFSFAQDYSIFGVLGIASYDFQDKLFIDANIRQEGNSRFSPDFRFGTFYSFGVGYLITEDLFTEVDFLDLLKVRATYGLTGNDAIGLNEYQSFLGFATSYAGVAGSEPVQLGNAQLTWENLREYNLGLTIGLFNRVDISATYFYRTSFDLLYNVPLSLTTSFDSRTTNVGEVVNKGLELSIDGNVIQTEDFFWSLGGHITLLDNEVTELPLDATGEPLEITSGTKYFAVEGFPINSWYMRTWAGVNPENGNPLWYLDGSSGETTSDYLEANPSYQGAGAIPATYGSINTQISYQGFYAGASLYYSFGNKVYDSWGGFLASDGVRTSGLGTFNQYADQLDRWQEPGDITDVPERIAGGNMLSNATSSRYLYDGGYVRLQTVRVGYNLPVTLLENLNAGLTSANIYLVANNLWTYTVDEELEHDPATGDTGFLTLYQPALQAITFGLEIQF